MKKEFIINKEIVTEIKEEKIECNFPFYRKSDSEYNVTISKQINECYCIQIHIGYDNDYSYQNYKYFDIEEKLKDKRNNVDYIFGKDEYECDEYEFNFYLDLFYKGFVDGYNKYKNSP